VTESSPHTNARIGTSPETEPVSRAQKRPTLCRREIDCVAFSEFIRVGVGGYNVTNVRFCVIRYLDSLLYFLPDCLRTESFLISEEWKTRSHSHKFENLGSRESPSSVVGVTNATFGPASKIGRARAAWGFGR
jgi:hypothetical protein